MRLNIPYLLVAAMASAVLFYLANPPELSAAPVLQLESTSGEKINLVDSDGRATLVNFWSPDCSISIDNLEKIQALHSRFARDMFRVVGVTMPYDPETAVSKTIGRERIPYPVVVDADGSIANAFPDVRFTPTAFLIDPSGQIVWRNTGRLPMSKITEKIEQTVFTRHLANRSLSLPGLDQ